MDIFTNNKPQLPFNTIEEINSLRNVSQQHIAEVAKIVNAMAHKLRHRIVRLLKEKKVLSVTELYVAIGVSQAVASKHLGVLRRVGVLASNRNGKFIYYSLSPSLLKKIYACIDILEVKIEDW